jgi:uncharacterized RDD family membrane protein YckC
MSELYAFNKKRLIATFIDLAGIILYVLILLGVALTTFFISGNIPKLNLNNAHLLGFLTLTFPVMIYFVISELIYSATPGKRFAGLKVTSFNGRPLTLIQAIVRNIIKFLPWEYAHTLVYILLLVPNSTNSKIVLFGLVIANIIPIIYVYFVLFGKDHRGPHDLISGTIVKHS